MCAHDRRNNSADTIKLYYRIDQKHTGKIEENLLIHTENILYDVVKCIRTIYFRAVKKMYYRLFFHGLYHNRLVSIERGIILFR